MEAQRGAVGPLIGLVTMQVTYCDIMVTHETFTFRYRSLLLGTEALIRQIFNVPLIDFWFDQLCLIAFFRVWEGIFQLLWFKNDTSRFIYVKIIPPKLETVPSIDAEWQNRTVSTFILLAFIFFIIFSIVLFIILPSSVQTQLKLSWTELALISSYTHPHQTSTISKKEWLQRSDILSVQPYMLNKWLNILLG